VVIDSQPASEALFTARKSGQGWFRADCPYCLDATGKADRRQSLGIKPSIAFFMCFKCGVRGRLKDVTPTEPARKQEDEDAPPRIPPPPFYEPLGADDAWGSIFLSDPRRYLVDRGVTQLTVAQARIGAVLEGPYSGRIIVPVLDVDEETWLGYSARDWTGQAQLRYKYPKGMRRGHVLYNQAALYRETDDPVVLVEGVFDALPYWPDAVACLGKPGDVHRYIMYEARRPIAVCLDGDAHEEGWCLSRQLRLHGVRSGSVRLPPCSDPNSVEPRWLREEARRCIQF